FGDFDGWFLPEADPQKNQILIFLLSTHYDVDALKKLYLDDMQNTLPGMQIIREDALTSAVGSTYLRWEVQYPISDGTTIHGVYYFYGTKNWNFVMVFSRQEGQYSEQDPIVDETAKTVRLIE
ncbi:MAG: hypothetical protein GYA17_15270, partial [Chloroflexi bacterium]|nr:hypothetical protein [Chloroflexota bacterium]